MNLLRHLRRDKIRVRLSNHERGGERGERVAENGGDLDICSGKHTIEDRRAALLLWRTMLITNSDVASIDALLNWWEPIEYIAEAFVILGCVGEFIAEFTEIKTPEFRHQLSKTSLLVLIAALGIELGALVRTNSLSGQEIALLNTVAADARTRAANAEGTAKGFDIKIAEARRGTAEAQRDAQSAKERASKADERASKNEKDAATLRKRAEDEALARAEIEDRVAWRHLTKEQQLDMAGRLKKFSGQWANIGRVSYDEEITSFATNIARMLQSATWHVLPPSAISIRETPAPAFGNPIEPVITGVTITSTEDSRAREMADALMGELHAHGFDSVISPKREPNKGFSVIWVLVENRPEGPQGEAKLRKLRLQKK